MLVQDGTAEAKNRKPRGDASSLRTVFQESACQVEQPPSEKASGGEHGTRLRQGTSCISRCGLTVYESNVALLLPFRSFGSCGGDSVCPMHALVLEGVAGLPCRGKAAPRSGPLEHEELDRKGLASIRSRYRDSLGSMHHRSAILARGSELADGSW